MEQGELFGAAVPQGFEYRTDFVGVEEETSLLRDVAGLDFSQVEMRGVVARRRTAHFGWTYGYERRATAPGSPIPEFLMPLRARIAAWAGIGPGMFAEALVTEYPEGAPIGWHRDAPMFGDVAGVSLGSPCRMRFRAYVSPKDAGRGRMRRATHDVELAPRSAYLMRGSARRDFEHSIPPVRQRRYSVTFRTIRR